MYVPYSDNTGLVRMRKAEQCAEDSCIGKLPCNEQPEPPAPVEYTITCSVVQHGSISASKESATAGTEITITVTPDANYQLKTLTANGVDISTAKKFEMPGANVVIEAEFEVIKYNITTVVTPGGAATIDVADSATAGTVLQGTISLNEGYTNYTISNVQASAGTLSWDSGSVSFGLTMPSEDVTVSVTVSNG